MADFRIAYIKLIECEGGYANNKADRGGETYKGISRRWFPILGFWSEIDKVKALDVGVAKINELLEDNLVVQEGVREFYKLEFWDKIKGDLINQQLVADNIFDYSVNSGLKTAVIATQKVIKVKADGIFGSGTLKALNEFDSNKFIKEIKKSRKKLYEEIVSNDNSQAVFLNGWLHRLERV